FLHMLLDVWFLFYFFFFFQAEDGIRDYKVTGVQTCALPIRGPVRFWDSRVLQTNRPSGFPVTAKPDPWSFVGLTSSDGTEDEQRSEERRVGKGGRARGGREGEKEKGG